jgi:hypothetical protein
MNRDSPFASLLDAIFATNHPASPRRKDSAFYFGSKAYEKNSRLPMKLPRISADGLRIG